ncbi:hypothetical protein IC757_15595 [Wenzhouxiangella sp. AB-CW3]|uniref:hypothetical protein n=1 Tax=Wenzhouxiangella sp. AB-CW3 TaxID=2771012 RepID=UPI00168ACC93|nr:hypothetical protein [Wenzhouxiangella sp. AB-CW3]QOC22412.1 hypothetical protein IC757_15595 [Wenzhouxiangella sp. AB-CW3]
MTALRHSLLMTTLLMAGTGAMAHDSTPWSIIPERGPVPNVISDHDALGLPGMRPRMTMNLPDSHWSPEPDARSEQGASFSWSLETWQLNTASLAHIQCNSATLTIDSYLAQDCRFVDQPLPADSVNLVQVRGNWTATPGLQFGFGAFQSQPEPPSPILAMQQGGHDFSSEPAGHYPNPRSSASEGLDFNVSFGIQTERVGDFLVGLQLARYRQRMSMTDFGLPVDESARLGPRAAQYGNSAQLMLGWRRGRFSGEMLGNHLEMPSGLGLSNEASTAPSALHTFDLELSWQALRNASISVGVSNVLDTMPRADEPGAESRLDESSDNIYGRIPYVRYKHDL